MAGPRHCLEALDVLVLAGGLATRLKGTLGATPKLLAPIAGRPYLEHLLDWLERFGARRVVLALGHRAEAILAHMAPAPRPHLALEAVVEPQPLGTAGAIRFARAKLTSDPVLVMNGDSLVDADLCALLARHREACALATLATAEVDDSGRYGRLVIDACGRIAAFIEKDERSPGGGTVSAGLYLLSSRLLDEIAAGAGASLERDVFARLPPGSLAAFPAGRRFLDIGTPEALARAAEMIPLAAAGTGGPR